MKLDKNTNETIGEDNEKEVKLVTISPNPNNNITVNNTDESSSNSNEEEEIDEDEKYESNKTCLQRLFGSITPGSMRASITSFSILSIGVACLSVPSYLSQIGIVFYIIFVIVIAFISNTTLRYLISIAKNYKVKSYNVLVTLILGKTMAFILDIVIIIKIFGVMIVYQIVIYNIIGSFVFSIGYQDQYSNNEDFIKTSFWSEFKYKCMVMFGISILCLLPLNIQKDVSKLRFSSIIGLASLIFTVIILIVQLPYYIGKYSFNDTVNISNIGNSVNNLSIFSAISTLVYSFSTHYGIFPIYDNLFMNTKRRIKKVISRGVALNSLFFIIVGVVGYLTFPIKTPDLIINRPSIDRLDLAMNICKGLICILMFAKIAINYNSLRYSLLSLLFKTPENTFIRNIILTLGVTLTSTLIGIIFSDVKAFIGFLGGFCSVFLSFVLPSLLYLFSEKRHFLVVIGVVLFNFIFISIGGIAGIKSLITFINSI